MILFLPWPPKELNPNARVHHMALHRAKKAYGNECFYEAKQQGAKQIDAAALNVTLSFCPPDNRARDLDNMLSAMKAGLDAVSKIVGVDDSKWEIKIGRANPREGGMVCVELAASTPRTGT